MIVLGRYSNRISDLVVIQPNFNDIKVCVYDLHPLHADNGGAPDEEDPGR